MIATSQIPKKQKFRKDTATWKHVERINPRYLLTVSLRLLIIIIVLYCKYIKVDA